MAVNGTGSLVILVIVFLEALAFQAQVEGKPQDNLKRDKEDNVSRIFDHTDIGNPFPEKAVMGQFPWQVLVIITKKTLKMALCGGSIIDQKWIMSAAHCFTEMVNKDGKPDGYIITLKSIRLYVGILLKNVAGRIPDYEFESADFEGNDKHAFIHEDYHKGVAANNDIALFKLKMPLSLTNEVYPILLATLLDVDLNRELEFPLTASGWGRMSFIENAKGSNELRYVTDLHIIQQDSCAIIFTGYDKDTMICHEDPGKKTGQGDSGGPVIFKTTRHDQDTYAQIGIVHRSSRILGTYRSIFMNVAHFRPWIHKTMSYIPDDKSIIEYPNGFFRSSGLWYRLFKDEQFSWDKARSKCRSFGMRLAEPRDDTAAEALQKDTLAKFGVFSAAWIGAQGDGDNFRFKVSGHIVPRDSPLLDYLSISLYDPTDGNCLFLNGENTEDPPYGFYQKGVLNYPLCEDSPDTSIIDVCPFNQRAIFTRSGSKRCVPTTTSCPDDGDYFTLTAGGPKQCFKVLKQAATWEQANKDCMDLNLTLAQPFAPVQLRSYIVQEYSSDFYVWLGACQEEPNKMMWKEGGEEITNEDPLWYPGQPNYHEGCLLLLTSETYWQKEPEKPFWNVKPTYEFYPLCELVLA